MEDALHHWALAHRRRIEVFGTGAWIAPPEYVILRKLQFFRESGSDKHLWDIRIASPLTQGHNGPLNAAADNRLHNF